MATIGQVYYNVIDKNNGTCISSGPSIFKEGNTGELVGRYGAKQFIKLGIQAKPGTIAILNETKTIMIGQSGIYELDDEDIVITSLYFNKPPKYIKDVVASEQAIIDGIAIIKTAEEELKTKVKVNTDNEYVSIFVFIDGEWMAEPDKTSSKFDRFWEEYNTAQSNFIKKYNEGLSKFYQGNNGIYTLPEPNDIKSPKNYDDLYDVIIDFVYE